MTAAEITGALAVFAVLVAVGAVAGTLALRGLAQAGRSELPSIVFLFTGRHSRENKTDVPDATGQALRWLRCHTGQAILGCGINVPSPREERNLAREAVGGYVRRVQIRLEAGDGAGSAGRVHLQGEPQRVSGQVSGLAEAIAMAKDCAITWVPLPSQASPDAHESPFTTLVLAGWVDAVLDEKERQRAWHCREPVWRNDGECSAEAGYLKSWARWRDLPAHQEACAEACNAMLEIAREGPDDWPAHARAQLNLNIGALSLGMMGERTRYRNLLCAANACQRALDLTRQALRSDNAGDIRRRAAAAILLLHALEELAHIERDDGRNDEIRRLKTLVPRLAPMPRSNGALPVSADSVACKRLPDKGSGGDTRTPAGHEPDHSHTQSSGASLPNGRT